MLKLYFLLILVVSFVISKRSGVDLMKILSPYLDDDIVTLNEMIDACKATFDIENQDDAKECAEQGMRLFDTNGDGSISRKEVIQNSNQGFNKW